MAEILQQQAASLDAGLDMPNGFREKEACRENKIGRIISNAKGDAKRGQLHSERRLKILFTPFQEAPDFRRIPSLLRHEKIIT